MLLQQVSMLLHQEPHASVAGVHASVAGVHASAAGAPCFCIMDPTLLRQVDLIVRMTVPPPNCTCACEQHLQFCQTLSKFNKATATTADGECSFQK